MSAFQQVTLLCDGKNCDAEFSGRSMTIRAVRLLAHGGNWRVIRCRGVDEDYCPVCSLVMGLLP